MCDSIVEYIKSNGLIYPGNPLYNDYKTKIFNFLKNQNLIRNDYAPCCVLNTYYYNNYNFTVNRSEAEMIRRTVVDMKHELFPDFYEQIFISHREKDKEQVSAFVELLHSIGIPRPTITQKEPMIFCTSHPSSYIANGENNLDEIRKQFNNDKHTFFILWYTDNYFESQACLNEAGAIWGMGKKYQEILAPKFEASKIGGLLDKQPVWFRSNDKYRLNTFKAQIESMFGLSPLIQNDWEEARDKFIAQMTPKEDLISV